jgi:hypothetical protein
VYFLFGEVPGATFQTVNLADQIARAAPIKGESPCAFHRESVFQWGEQFPGTVVLRLPGMGAAGDAQFLPDI